MKRTVKFWTYLLAVFAVSASPVFADSLVQGDLLFELNQGYAGTGTPQGISPWLTATFTNLDPITVDNVLNYRVQLIMASSGLSTASTQSVGSWFFNVTDALPALGLLKFESISGDQATIFRGRDTLEAGGGLFFDLEFLFDISPFAAGETSTYIVSSTQQIDALSFSFLSTNSNIPESTNYYSAANILDVTVGLNSWIAAATAQTPSPGPGPGPAPVPEPATMILLSFGLAGLTFFGRKKFFA